LNRALWLGSLTDSEARPSRNSWLGELQITDADAGAIDLDYRWPSILSLSRDIKLYIAPGPQSGREFRSDLKLSRTKLNDIVLLYFAADAVVSGIETPNIGQDSEADGLCAEPDWPIVELRGVKQTHLDSVKLRLLALSEANRAKSHGHRTGSTRKFCVGSHGFPP
jgi:hypothetical protein